MERQNKNHRNTITPPREDIMAQLANLLKNTYKDGLSRISTIITFFLGLTPMSIGYNPFGTAFFFASSLPCVPMAIGLFFSAAASGLTAPVPMLCSTLGAFLKIYLAKKGKLSLSARIILASCTGLIGGLLRIPFVSGDSGEPIRTILLSLSVPLFCTIFLGLDKKTAVFGVTHEVIARLSILFCITRLLSYINIGLFSLSCIASIGIILFLTRLYCKYISSTPSPSSCIIGCVIGFVCGIGTGDIDMVPLLGILGLSAGFLFPLHEITSLFCSPISAILFATAADDSVAGLTMFIHSCFGIGIYFLLCKPNAEDYIKYIFVKEEEKPKKPQKKEISALEESFSSLSTALRTLNELGEKKELTELPLCCSDCGGCFCHGLNEFEVKLGMNEYIKNGKTLAEHLLKRCPNSEGVKSSLEIMRSRDDDVLETTARKYEEFSKILSSIRADNEKENVVDTLLSLRLSEMLNTMGLSFSHTRVYGNRLLRAEIYDVQLSEMECSANALKSSVSTTLARKVSDPFFIVGDNCVSMRFESVPLCKIEHSMMTVAKQGEVMGGDTVSTFESTDGLFFGLIGDGMGSGENAALCSKMGAILIEKLVLLGSDKNEVMRLLNKMLLSKGDEVFTTVDLLTIDKFTLDAEVMKAGGAPTFLVRGEKLTSLSARSAPLGLLPTLVAERLKFKAQTGDIIVMMSDGAFDGDDIPAWLEKYFSEKRGESTAVMTATLLELARENAPFPDDISILVAKIK